MKQFTRLVWDPKHTVHVEELDAQHQKLFKITNDILDLYENGSGDLYPSLQELVPFAIIHFRSESVVMLESNYPDYREHNVQHSEFIDRMLSFLKSYKEGDPDLTVMILSYLHDWYGFHTTKLDLKYGKHLMRIKAVHKK